MVSKLIDIFLAHRNLVQFLDEAGGLTPKVTTCIEFRWVGEDAGRRPHTEGLPSVPPAPSRVVNLDSRTHLYISWFLTGW
jgi:hypothetical protein